MFTKLGGNWLDTYLELAPNGQITAALEKKLPAYLKKYMTAAGNTRRLEIFYDLFLTAASGRCIQGLQIIGA